MERNHPASLCNVEVDRPAQHDDPIHLVGRLGGRREAVLQRQDQPLADRKQADEQERHDRRVQQPGRQAASPEQQRKRARGQKQQQQIARLR